jgi:hypothetical protein
MQDMTSSKTLIVLLAYKSNPEWLEITIQSVAGQTRGDFRCVIVDSTPETDPNSSLISSVGNSRGADPRFIYRHRTWEPHADVARKVNSTVLEFGGDCDYVAIMPDDDYLAPRFLEVQAGALDGNPAAGFAQGGVHFFGDRHGFWLHDLRLDKQVVDQVGQNQFAGTCLMRMVPFREFGGYDEDSVPQGFPMGLEDFTLFIHFLRAGWRYTAAPEILLFCRQRPDQHSRKLYESALFWPLVQKLCHKQGIELTFMDAGGISLKYQQVQRSLAP